MVKREKELSKVGSWDLMSLGFAFPYVSFFSRLVLF